MRYINESYVLVDRLGYMACISILDVTEKNSEYQFWIFKFELRLLFGKLNNRYLFNIPNYNINTTTE